MKTDQNEIYLYLNQLIILELLFNIKLLIFISFRTLSIRKRIKYNILIDLNIFIENYSNFSHYNHSAIHIK